MDHSKYTRSLGMISELGLPLRGPLACTTLKLSPWGSLPHDLGQCALVGATRCCRHPLYPLCACEPRLIGVEGCEFASLP